MAVGGLVAIGIERMPAHEDRHLLPALGDRAAFAQLHDALTPRIYARLVAVADEERASTLTVAVLVEAWRRAPRLRAQQRSVSAWALAYTHALETALRPDAAS